MGGPKIIRCQLLRPIYHSVISANVKNYKEFNLDFYFRLLFFANLNTQKFW